MGQAMDFEKLRKKRRRAKLLKRLLVLGALLLLLLGILSINSLLADVGLLTTVSDFVSGFGGGGYPIAVPGGVLRDTKAVSGDIAVLNDTSLYVYSSKGKEVLSMQQLTDNTVMAVGGGRILVYDVGGTRFSISSRSKELLESETEYGILSATVNDRGDYALVSSSRQYVAQVVVYNSNFETAFEWYSSNQHIVGVSIAPRGGYMAAGCVGAQGGILRSYLHIFDFSSDSELALLELADELLLSVDYLEGGRIAVLTDRALRVVSQTGAVESVYSFSSRSLAFVQRGGAGTLLVLEDGDRVHHAVLLDGELKVLGEAALDYKVRGAAVGGGVYLLSDEGVHSYSAKLEEEGLFELRGVSRILYAGGKLYYFSREEIAILPG